MSSWQWDPRQDRIVKSVADEENVITTIAKEALEIFMKEAVTEIKKFVPVVVPNFGKFFLSPFKTHEKIDQIIRAEKNGTITREQLIDKLKVFWPLHQIANKHFPRTGIGYRVELAKQQQENELHRTNSNESEL